MCVCMYVYVETGNKKNKRERDHLSNQNLLAFIVT